MSKIQDTLRRARHELRQHLPDVSSSHIAEAFAAALGQGSSIALQASVKAGGFAPMAIDTNAFYSRLTELGHSGFRVPELPLLVAWNAIRDVTGNRTDVFDDMGYLSEHRTGIRKCARSNSGLFLVCGPTGTRKSDTLAAILSIVDDDRRLTLAQAVREMEAGRTRHMTVVIDDIRHALPSEALERLLAAGHGVWSTLHTDAVEDGMARLRDLGFVSFDRVSGILVQDIVSSPHQGDALDLMNVPSHLMDTIERLFGAKTGAIRVASKALPGPDGPRSALGRTLFAEFMMPDAEAARLASAGEMTRLRDHWIEALGGIEMIAHLALRIGRGEVDLRILDWVGPALAKYPPERFERLRNWIGERLP